MKNEIEKEEKKEAIAALYCRVSTYDKTVHENPDELKSTSIQEKHLREFCKARGYKIYDVYSEVFTGTKFEGRKELQRLLEDARQEKFTHVLTTRIDRLSRRVKDFHDIMAEFDKHGIVYETLRQSFDQKTIEGKVMRNIFAVFAELESDLIKERTFEAMLERFKKRLWGGGRHILGYDWKDGKHTVNQKEANLVRRMFKLYLELESCSKVAKELNRKGYRTKKWTTKTGEIVGGSLFNRDSVHNHLKKRFYIGKIIFKNQETEGIHTPIVPEPLFERVQKLLKKNAEQPRAQVESKYELPLLKRLFCGFCGHGMTTHWGKKKGIKYFYYKCSKILKMADKNICESVAIGAKEIENFLRKYLFELSQQPAVVEASRKVAEEVQEKEIFELSEELKRKIDLKLTAKRRKTNLQNKILSLSGKEFVTLRKNLNQMLIEAESEIEQHEEEIPILEARLRRLKSQKVDVDLMMTYWKEFDKSYDEATPEERMMWFHLLLRRVTVKISKKTRKGYIRIFPRGNLPPIERIVQYIRQKKKWTLDDVTDKIPGLKFRGKWLPGLSSNYTPFLFTDDFVYGLINTENGIKMFTNWGFP
ncbi:MAG: recombinase family protein [Elusimicrobiota bacterium]